MHATPVDPSEVPIRNRAVLVCGVGLAALTILAVVVATIVAMAR